MFNSPMLLTSDESYEITYSVRFDGSNDYMHRTPGSAGNRKTWTFSCWAKWSKGQPYIFSAASDLNNQTSLSQNGSGLWQIVDVSGGTTRVNKQTTALYRDPAAWYHLVLIFNNGTINFYVNGEEVTSWSVNTNTLGSGDTQVCNTVSHVIGDNAVGPAAGNGWNGYVTETILVDGLALDPTYFGEFDSVTGSWKPKKPEVSNYGTNGFWLDMTDTANLGNDAAGTNDFTLVSLSSTDAVLDSPTHNYATFDPIFSASNMVLSDGNLACTAPGSGTGNVSAISSFPITAKTYFEVTISDANAGGWFGVSSADRNPSYFADMLPSTWAYAPAGGYRYSPGSPSYATAWGTSNAVNGTVIGVAVHPGTGIWFSNNGTWCASGDPANGTDPMPVSTALPDVVFASYTRINNNAKVTFNFGQRTFVYSPPAGFEALSTETQSSPGIKSPSKNMDVVLYTGNGTSQSITGLDFQPDLVWVKSRLAATDHAVYDSIRGAQRRLETNTPDIEATADSGLTAFNSNGFSVGSLAQVNTNTATYAAWCWKRNVSAGFDVVVNSHTSGSATVCTHNLGAKPSFVIRKGTNVSDNWRVWHSGLTSENYYVELNSTGVQTNLGSSVCAPSTTSVTIPSDTATGNYVHYIWSEIPGYSKFGKYTGNGLADGPFVYTGFRPRWVLVKRVDTGPTSWLVFDTERDSFNEVVKVIYPNSSGTEDSSDGIGDTTSTGFKVRRTFSGINASGGTYIFAAFAEYPFGGDTISEGTAR